MSDLVRGERHELPNRRYLETQTIEVAGHRFELGIGRRDSGDIAEVFLNSGKEGSLVGAYAHDTAVLISLLMQFGCPREEVRRKLMRNPDGSASGVAAAVLDHLATIDAADLVLAAREAGS